MGGIPRIQFGLLALAAFLLTSAPPAGAQRVSAGIHRIGFLGPPEEPRFSEIREGLMHGLGDLGLSSQDIEILEVRLPRGDQSQVAAAVQKLIQQRVRALVVIGSNLAKLAREADSRLPIVYLTPGDPVRHGLAKSLARPGGNTTAMTFEYPELAGKRLELLKDMFPRARRVLILYDPRDDSPRRGAAAAREAASKLGLELVEREVRTREDIARGLEALGQADALLAIPGGLPTGHYAEIIRAANARRVPTMFHSHAKDTAVALASYGAADAAVARQMARHVAKILRGEKAGNLPVERPLNLQLIINLKTAKALGLTIPPEVLQRADRVIR